MLEIASIELFLIRRIKWSIEKLYEKFQRKADGALLTPAKLFFGKSAFSTPNPGI